jgi:hypothetical protein
MDGDGCLSSASPAGRHAAQGRQRGFGGGGPLARRAGLGGRGWTGSDCRRAALSGPLTARPENGSALTEAAAEWDIPRHTAVMAPVFASVSVITAASLLKPQAPSSTGESQGGTITSCLKGFALRRPPRAAAHSASRAPAPRAPRIAARARGPRRRWRRRRPAAPRRGA